jgi:hypothetical protein
LKGQNLHGDEGFYGPKDGIGTFAEYTLDDFVDVNNATFSSKHNIGCAMIELDRYAPILPEGEKCAQESVSYGRLFTSSNIPQIVNQLSSSASRILYSDMNPDLGDLTLKKN